MSEFRRRLMLQEKGQSKLDAIGVFIYDIYGKLTTPDDWNSANNDKAVGVYVGVENHRFVVAKEDAAEVGITWGDSGVLADSVLTSTNQTVAITDFAGKHNTNELVKVLSSAPAFFACINYIFPNGKGGYMGAVGEWKMCIDNKNAIDNALLKCGGNIFSVANYWASTQYNKWSAWRTYNVIRFNFYTRGATEATTRAFLSV